MDSGEPRANDSECSPNRDAKIRKGRLVVTQRNIGLNLIPFESPHIEWNARPLISKSCLSVAPLLEFLEHRLPVEETAPV